MTGQAIKELRKALKMTQQQFALTLNVDFKTVNRWENGRARPSNLAIRVLKRLKHKHAINDAKSGVSHKRTN